MCCRFRYRALIFFPIFLVGFFMPCMLLYYKGYLDNSIWNHFAVETQGLIINHDVRDSTCCEQCNCFQVCNSDNSCYTSCSTCCYTCYDGSVIAVHSVNDVNYTVSFLIYSGQDDKTALINTLDSNYPIGTKITYYYNSRNPQDVRLQLADPQGFYIGAMVWIGVGILLLIIWGIVELVRFLKKKQIISRIKAFFS